MDLLSFFDCPEPCVQLVVGYHRQEVDRKPSFRHVVVLHIDQVGFQEVFVGVEDRFDLVSLLVRASQVFSDLMWYVNVSVPKPFSFSANFSLEYRSGKARIRAA